MLTAGEFIDYFVDNTSAAVNRESIKAKINIAQRALLGTDSVLTRVLPDPIFVTQDGVYSYKVSDALKSAVTGDPVGDVRCIKTPYARNTSGWLSIPILNRRTHLRTSYDDIGPLIFAPVTSPESRGVGRDDCMAYWDEQYNPGDSDGRWRCETYLWPAPILVDEDLLTIPDDFAFDLLFEKVSALVEGPAYGSAREPMMMASEAERRFRMKYAAQTIYNRTRNSPPLNA